MGQLCKKIYLNFYLEINIEPLLLTPQVNFYRSRSFSVFLLNDFRLVWALQNIPQMKGALAKDDVLFGTVDTWLLHKFSAGKLHLTDISNAAATGYYYFKFVLIFVK